MTERGKNVHLTPEESDAVTGVNLIREGLIREEKTVLVGSLWTSRKFNAHALQDTMKSAWRPKKGFVFREIMNNQFLIQFVDVQDKEKVMHGGPWSFDKALFVLKESGMNQASKVKLDEVAIWIRIYDLPVGFMTPQMEEVLGEKVGKLEEVDEATLIACGKFMRLRVVININKPLRRGIMIQLERKKVWIELKYESLPNFCYTCGRLGHVAADCEVEVEENLHNEYGEWLRASPMKVLMGRDAAEREREQTVLDERSGKGGNKMVEGEKENKEGGRRILLEILEEADKEDEEKDYERGGEFEKGLNLTEALKGVELSGDDPKHKESGFVQREAMEEDGKEGDNTGKEGEGGDKVTNLNSGEKSFINLEKGGEKEGVNITGKEQKKWTRRVRGPCGDDHVHTGGKERKDSNGLEEVQRQEQEIGSVEKRLKVDAQMNDTRIGRRGKPLSPNIMNLLSYNCRGLGKAHAVTKLKNLVNREALNVVFLMETKRDREGMERVRRRLGIRNCFTVDKVGRLGGLCLLWEEGVEVEFKSYTSHHINALVRLEEEAVSWRFTGIYGWPNHDEKHLTMGLLRHLHEDKHEAWLCVGDMNMVVVPEDKEGGNEVNFGRMIELRNTLEACELRDIPFEGYRFTWDNGREGDGFIQERLDMGFANETMMDIFPEIRIHHLDRDRSDHLPIYVDFEERIEEHKLFRGHRPFTFEVMWLTNEECEGVVDNAWSNPGSSVAEVGIIGKIGRCGTD